MTTITPSSLSRRYALRMAAAGAGVALVGSAWPTNAALAAAPSNESGADLAGWDLAVGDGIWTGPGQSPVGQADIALTHAGTVSELAANVQRRGVMAHAIAFRRYFDLHRLSLRHTAELEFRLPDLPATSNWEYNAQTLEIGLFVWDGPDTRLDHGMAIQWVLNPWVPEFGEIRAWSMTEPGPVWLPVGSLAPDTAWHRLFVDYKPGSGLARLEVDGRRIDVAETLTPKAAHWGTTIDARLQAEIVSVWPGSNQSVPAHRAEFRNWAWRTTPGRSLPDGMV
ncbi:MAG: hypothetical protein RIB65_18005 [Ilumatobacter fluminis]|uniref:hypothetical protein n=1 Tax=Ilumatobacter fluminis TaxID=467091 RepID=UPI0032EF2A0C